MVGKVTLSEYETAEGEKRKSLDVNAYSIGAAITRFASVRVKKAEQSSKPAANDPWAAPPVDESEPPF